MIPVGVACSCLVVSYLCVYATGKGWCARNRPTHITLPHITHLTAKPSRMIGVQVARAVHTDRVHVNMSSINMYVGRERSSGLIKMTCYVTFL